MLGAGVIGVSAGRGAAGANVDCAGIVILLVGDVVVVVVEEASVVFGVVVFVGVVVVCDSVAVKQLCGLEWNAGGGWVG